MNNNNKLKTNLIKSFLMNPLTEIIRSIDECFGKEYFTLKDIFIEENQGLPQWNAKYDELIEKYYKGYLNED